MAENRKENTVESKARCDFPSLDDLVQVRESAQRKKEERGEKDGVQET